ncbi:hypothetical protein A1O3_06870 [Capronia epimyces CBS 606.96]|uniref:Enoyl reductase (ER) domain-containing protein n=1 Tax=Capronia epimyces CBS 606.96 TaxID=1182542 RepID=W9XK47_9EURO|nr:uncharacterized protein A1O3_06870 [Capronia epimyces CBS 606.96]EXJ80588.1 hypothetical protein A1O3_06870 [Capronia epimyces CBS 606.96]
MPSWSNTPKGTMAAAVLTNPGQADPSDCFTYVTDYPKPSLPSEDWVLIRVRAAGLNRAELRARNVEHVSPLEFGMFIDEFHTDAPKVMGEEYVGEVEEAGSSSGFKKGEVVCGWAYGGGKPYDGAYAEYTIAHKKRCWRLPDTAREIPWEVLGAVPMGLWTAYGAIFSAGETKPGSTVLVHGGTSSVGIWAILVAKDKGCTVIATTRQASKVKRLKDAGADHVILEEDIQKSLDEVYRIAPKGVNTVVEIVGINHLKKVSMPALAVHGTCVLMGVLDKGWALPEFDSTYIPITRKLTTYTTMEEDYEPSTRVLAETMEKIRSGVYKPEVFLDKAFHLKDIGKAHQYMEDNKAVGKIVVTV